MTSEIRVNKLTNRIGLSTVTFADSGIGVTVTGRIDPDTDSARDLGTTSVRWRNAYVDTYYGDGSNLTGLSGVSVANQADNRLITATGTTDALNGESSLTFDGSKLSINATSSAAGNLVVKSADGSSNQVWIVGRSSDNTGSVSFRNNADNAYTGRIEVEDTNGMQFQVGGSERFRIFSDGKFGFGTNSLSETTMAEFSSSTGGGAIGSNITIRNSSTNSVNNIAELRLKTAHGVARIFKYNTSETVFMSHHGGASDLIMQADGASNFRVNTNGSERVRITGTGRFGIGTNSPDHIFEVEDNNSSIAVSRDGANAALLFKSNSVGQAGQIQVAESSGGGAMQFFNKNTSGVLRECFRLSPTNRTVSFFASGPSYPAGSSNDEQYYQFANSYAYNWTMRLRNYTWGYGLRIDTDDDSTREGLMIFSTKSGVNQSKASIHMDGTYRSRNNTYTSFSDIKLKENIVDAGSQWDDIKGLKVRNFNFKIDDPSQKMIGVIAQEAETVCPNLVRDIPDTEEKDGEIHETGTHTKEVKYSILYMKAIKCLQEAQARIETLEAKVAALEGS